VGDEEEAETKLIYVRGMQAGVCLSSGIICWSERCDALRLTKEYSIGLTKEYSIGLTKEYSIGLTKEYSIGLTKEYSIGLTPYA
jgi:hypothetical protein